MTILDGAVNVASWPKPEGCLRSMFRSLGCSVDIPSSTRSGRSTRRLPMAEGSQKSVGQDVARENAE